MMDGLRSIIDWLGWMGWTGRASWGGLSTASLSSWGIYKPDSAQGSYGYYLLLTPKELKFSQPDYESNHDACSYMVRGS